MDKIRKGDEVVVIAGRDKGKRGTVVSRVDDRHLVVEGIVMLFNAATGKGDRVGFKVLEDGRKVRVFRSNGEMVKA
jgi:large subunit ribosomal protein L24